MSLSTSPTKSSLYRGTGKPLTVTPSSAPASPAKREVKSNLSTEPKNSAQVFKEVRNLLPKQEEIKNHDTETSFPGLSNKQTLFLETEPIQLNRTLHEKTLNLEKQPHFSTPFTKSMPFLGTLLNIHNGVMFTGMSQGISPEKFVPMFGAFATIANINFAFHRLNELNELEKDLTLKDKPYLIKDVKALKFIDSLALAGVNTAVFALPLFPQSFPVKNYQIFSGVLAWSFIKHVWVATGALSAGNKADVFQNLAEGVFCGGAFVALAFWNNGGILGPTSKEENDTAALAAGIASFVVVATILGRTFIPSLSSTSRSQKLRNNLAYSLQLNRGELGATEEKTHETEVNNYRRMDEEGEIT